MHGTKRTIQQKMSSKYVTNPELEFSIEHISIS